MSKPAIPIVRFHHSPEVLAGLIYGLVTATAVIAVLADKNANVAHMSAAAFGTSLALALTYVYAHWLAGAYSGAAGHAGWRDGVRFEASTLVGPLVLACVMLVEQALGVSIVAATEAAMWVGVFMLFVLGYRIALQGGHSFAASFGFGLLDASIGALLIAVKVLVH